MTIRVLVADDQEMVRVGLCMILNAQPGIDVVATASNGVEAVRQARQLRPDVCLLDIRMPELDGIEATAQLAGPECDEPLNVVIITTFDLDEHVYAALRAGAKGFLLKDAGPALLVEAVHAAARGDALISPAITARLLHRFAGAGPTTDPAGGPLTAREESVLDCAARGLTNQDIASELFISVSTVKSHIAALMHKLGARNRVEIVIWAYETGRRWRR